VSDTSKCADYVRIDTYDRVKADRDRLAAELAEAKRENARLREQISEMVEANKWKAHNGND
jgi:hypothetical protein